MEPLSVLCHFRYGTQASKGFGLCGALNPFVSQWILRADGTYFYTQAVSPCFRSQSINWLCGAFLCFLACTSVIFVTCPAVKLDLVMLPIS